MVSTATAAFQTAAIAPIRRPLARVEIAWTDPFIDPTIFVTSNNVNYVDNKSQACDTKTITTRKWAHCDGVIKADGTYFPCPDALASSLENQMGWYTSTACNASSVWTGTYPLLGVNFVARPILALLVSGDTVYNEYPVDFTIKLYQDDAVLVYALDVVDNDLMEWFLRIDDENMNDIIYMSLELKKWSTPSRVGKITEFYTSIIDTFEGDDIVSLSLLDESEVTDGTLPIGNISSNELDLELQNIMLIRQGFPNVKDPYFPGNTDSLYHNLMKINRRITLYLGFQLANPTLLPAAPVEYVKCGVFFSGDWSAKEIDSSTLTVARDRMELLRNNNYPADVLFEEKTLYYIANAVLQSALLTIPMYDLKYEIGTELLSYVVPYAWFDKNKSYMEILRTIAEACLGSCFMTKNDVLVIGSSILSDEVDLAITQDNYFDKDQPAKTDQLKNTIVVETQPLKLGVAPEDVYESPDLIDIAGYGTVTLDIVYSDQPVRNVSAVIIENTKNITVDGVNTVYYPWGIHAVVDCNEATAGKFKLKVVGRKLTVEGEETVTVSDPVSIKEYGVLTYNFPKNPLIQTKTTATTIANSLLTSYSTFRKDIEVQWRGNPSLELGDIVQIPIYKKGTVDNQGTFYVSKSTLEYDGSLSGSISGVKTTLAVPPLGLMIQETMNASDPLITETASNTDQPITETMEIYT